MNKDADLRARVERLESDARDILGQAIASAMPDRLVKRAIERGCLSNLDRYDDVIVLCCGKAAAGMAVAVASLGGVTPSRGLITGPHSMAIPAPIGGLEVMKSAHPVPDAHSLASAARAVELATSATGDDLVIVLLSGGGSSLWALPDEGLTLDDLRDTTATLLRSGADIGALNTVRKHLSAIKGGRLAAAAWPARVSTLIISDVVGDDPSTVASGPTVVDATTFDDALAAVDRFGGRSAYPIRVIDHLQAGAAGRRPETPKPGNRLLATSSAEIIGSNSDAIDGAAERAGALGYRVSTDYNPLTGEAADVGRRLAREIAGLEARDPLCLIWGGETTVTVSGAGRGGRNQELALAAAIELGEKQDPVLLLSVGTDGVDGPTDAAGACISYLTAMRAADMGLRPGQFLADNNAYEFFDAVGGLIRTGPTGTNVMDVQLALIDRR